MSEPVAPLSTQTTPEPVFSATPLIGIEPSGLHGMIALRGDLASQTLVDAVNEVVGLAAPGPLSVTADGDAGAAPCGDDGCAGELLHLESRA